MPSLAEGSRPSSPDLNVELFHSDRKPILSPATRVQHLRGMSILNRNHLVPVQCKLSRVDSSSKSRCKLNCTPFTACFFSPLRIRWPCPGTLLLKQSWGGSSPSKMFEMSTLKPRTDHCACAKRLPILQYCPAAAFPVAISPQTQNNGRRPCG
ncbi:hypothetical protein Q8A67_012629 [Cirrhinus molitorella]|uniref:Uncharacterized protein n=1 Tax=Cirrhinus molitorella TaxID=172907 RepID=A0AA88PJV2_9TELE|nr:hypothetical protein Q8A67_012629 [Cirrhinus molitorella]